MADRVTPPPSGDSGEPRPAAPRPTGGYSDRPQTPRSSGGYSERPPQPARTSSAFEDRPQTSRSSGGSSAYPPRSQPPRVPSSSGQRPSSAARSSGGYSDRPQTARSSSAYGERRPAAPRSPGSSAGRQTSPRRIDVIRCENCGEDYSTTYKRCPFCDERPGRGGVSGRRVSNTRGGGYGRPVNPIQIAGLVISLALIASALFIVIRFVGAPIFGGSGKPGANSSGAGSSTNQSSQSGQISTSGSHSSTAPQSVQAITLNNSDFTLENGGTFQLMASLLPVGAIGEVSWSSSDVTLATVDATGLVTNVNTGSADATVTISATCSGVTTETSVTCKARSSGGTGTAAVGSRGRIVNAEKGLNIRSGPGTSYSVVASAQNGATITILGEENGFYKINYSGDNVGYVSKDYVSIG